jgi:hypothetical protein
MSFIRKIRKKGKTYLAEVENRWVEGKCVQRHIRYIGKEADGRTILSSSLSDVVVDEVKLYGPLLVLNHLANQIDLPFSCLAHGRAKFFRWSTRTAWITEALTRWSVGSRGPIYPCS